MGGSDKMNTDIVSIVTVTGLLLFIYNYSVGWIAGFKILNITKLHHQLIYILLLLNIFLLLFSLDFLSNKFLLYLISLLFLLFLTYGSKGGIYHRIISTAAFAFYIFTMLNYQFFKFID